MRITGIRLASAGVLAAMIVGAAEAQQPQRVRRARPRVMRARPWRLGVQAYTFNRFTFFEAIDKTASLGLHYIEGYPGQRLSQEHPGVKFDHTLPVSTLAAVKNKLDAAKVRLVCYGVVRLSADEKQARKVFDFAKVMGIETLTAEPASDAFDLLDKLTEEYQINVAIHNHPKPSHYYSPERVLEAIEGHSPRIGACADTGHWMRSGINPVEALRKLEGHIISSHFKDLDKLDRSGHDVPFGTGKGDVKAMLAELKRQNFRGPFSIEYEYNWENSVPDIAKCVAYFREVEKELRPGR